MSQVAEYVISGSPLQMTGLKAELEAIFAAIASANRGATAPDNPFEGMFWWDSSANPEILKRYTVAAGWATLLSVNITTGTVTLGNAYETVFIPAGAMISAVANSAAQGTTAYASDNQQVDYWAFDGATEEFVFFNLVMPENWDLGTIKTKFYWLPSSGCSAGDTVEWEIAAGAKSNDDTFDAAPGTAQVISDTVLAGAEADLHISAATPAITIGGTPALGDMINFKVSRNVGGTDDMTEDAKLLGFMLQYKAFTGVAAW